MSIQREDLGFREIQKPSQSLGKFRWSKCETRNDLYSSSLKCVCEEKMILELNHYRKIVTNREWLGTMKYYTNCRQTWAVENFFSHTLLHYCPKQNSYSYDAYNIRNMLAVIDHNHHKEREVAVGQDGAPYSQAQVSRRTKQWVAYERKRPKDFSYIPGKYILNPYFS